MRKFRLPLLDALLLISLALPGLTAAADNMELPGRNADPDVIYPPGQRNRQSGAPVAWPKLTMDKKWFRLAMIDRLEYGNPDEGSDNYLWDAQGWLGGDTHKFWWKTEGEGPIHGGGPEDSEFQALYNRMISPFFGAQAGIRYDTNPGADRAFAVLGIQGLAPYRFETDTAFFISDDGDLSFRGEFEYELLLTQRLILQPRLEINASANDVPQYGLGQGINNTEVGLRLRYEIRREFAPYIGVRYESLQGETKDIAERAGEATSSVNLVIGIRAWF